MKVSDPKAIVEEKLGVAAAELFDDLSRQAPEHANAIVFIQGDQLDRASAVASLYKKGFAGHILITGNNVLVGLGKRPDENDFSLHVLQDYLVSHSVPLEAIRIDEQSMNSRDQAASIIRISKEQEWSKILVVVSLYHMLRAYLALVKQMALQQWQGRIIMQGVKLPWDRSPAGRTKTTLEMLLIEMEKIQTYARDLATIEEGMQAFQRFLK